MSSLCLMLIKSSWLNSGLELATLIDRRKVEDMVPKRFHKWLKVFGKQESE